MSRKESYYFTHDSNARNDEKLLAVRMKFKWEGYGLFWAIVEKMRDASDYILSKDYNLIAYDLRSDSSTIKAIVEDFGLFDFTDCGKGFYSKRLKNNMEFKEAKSQIARDKANKRWSKKETECNSNTTAMQQQCNSNAIKEKESKVKESKVKDIKTKEKSRFAPPSVIEIEEYFFEKTQDLDFSKQQAQIFYDFYASKNWMVGKNKMSRWKHSVSGWINRNKNFQKEKSSAQKEKSLKGFNGQKVAEEYLKKISR